MKRMHTGLFCVVLLLHGYLHSQPPIEGHSHQRQAKPLLFANLPDSLEMNYAEFNKLINGVVNEQIIAQLSSTFRVNGKVQYKGQTQPGTFSINIKLQNYDNALFNVTMRLMADNSTLIRGRIIHPRYDDVLILSQEKGKYIFRKKYQRYVMPE